MGVLGMTDSATRARCSSKPRNTRGKRQAIKPNGPDDASLHAQKQHNLETCNTRGKRQAIKLNGLNDASLHAKKQHNLELP